MTTPTWRHTRTTQPPVGQRCLVWDTRYRCVVLAYWTADKYFEEWISGKMRRVDGDRWQPEPWPPEAE